MPSYSGKTLGKRSEPSKRRVGESVPKSEGYNNEVLAKEHKSLLQQARFRAKYSSNPLYRAHHLGDPVFSHDNISLLAAASQDYTRTFQFQENINSITNMVNGTIGEVLLSRGVIPSVPVADYKKFPQHIAWSMAEQRHEILRQELDSLEKEIENREKEVQMKARHTMTMKDDAAFSSITPKTSSIQSTFKWKTHLTKSVTRATFDWPLEPVENLYEVSKTKYGDCSRMCDYMGQRKMIKPSRPRSRKSSPSRG